MNVDDYRKAVTAEMREGKGIGIGRTRCRVGAGSIGRCGRRDPDPLTKAIATFRDSFTTGRGQANRPAGHPDRDVSPDRASTAYRSSFRDALRAVAEDKDPGLRSTKPSKCWPSTRTKSRKQLLLRGLQNPGRGAGLDGEGCPALWPTTTMASRSRSRAGFLGGNYDLDAKEEALRALVSDPNSTGLFADILADRSQPQRLRSLSASGLRLVDPQRFDAARAAHHHR